jgi:hypothetical protein
MYLNSEESIKLGRQVHRKYGSWEAARRAGAAVPLELGDLRDELESATREKIIRDALKFPLTRP